MKPIKVISNFFAKSSANEVGAPIPTIIPILDITAFCMMSNPKRPEHITNCSSGFNISLHLTWPINLSSALCLPTSSAKWRTLPLSVNKALA